MSDLGQLLKKARLDKGISLDHLEEMTKIRKRYLEAIEEGDYKILPGSFYVRAFIKSYSESVGLDPNEVLALYGNAIPAHTVEAAAEPIRRKRNSARNTEKLSKWASNILMLSFILLILGVLYYFIGNSYKGDASKQVDPNEKITDKLAEDTGASGDAGGKTDAGKPPMAGGQQTGGQVVQQNTAPPATPVVTLAKTENNIDYYTVTNADKVDVQLKIIGEECWLKIDKLVPAAEGRKQERQEIEQKLYKKGETRDWTSDSGVFMRVGFPPAAEVIVNGTAISLGTKKDVKQIQIDLQKPL
ncbi:helix-turn-helix domain-containing protein [Paenibacillus sp. GYB003]|uniref:helix-turn-helix domain-containing protein n=1 Tax=Paenibacillus sp. GYB003 TaxID=2994392 RepID=UPI002F962034